MTAQATLATDRAARTLEYSQKRDRILALWNTGDYTYAEIGGELGLNHRYVGSVLRRARLAGVVVLTIPSTERGRRIARSLRLRRDSQPEAMTPDVSLQLRTAWLAGVSAQRIAVMLDTSERLVRAEARRLGLSRRRAPTVRSCHDCGSTGRHTAFPGPCKPRGRLDRCTDCALEYQRLAERLTEAAGPKKQRAPVVTRAAYRAAYRQRATLAQGDLVDLLVPPP